MFFRPNVERLEAHRDVEGLAAALDHKAPEIRSHAALALGRLGDRLAVEPLIGYLGRGGAEADISAAIFALAPFAESQDLRAVAALAGQRGSQGKPWDATVSTALARCRDPEFLLGVVAKPGPLTLRLWALDELSNLDDPRVPVALARALSDPELRERAKWKLVALGEPALEPLFEQLREPSSECSMEVIELATRIGGERAVGPLSTLLGDSDPAIRIAAVSSLIAIGGPSVVDPLLQALGDNDHEVARIAAAERGARREPRAVESLIAMLDGPGSGLGTGLAYSTLREIGGPQAESATAHDRPQVGDRVQVGYKEWQEVGMPGDRIEMEVGVGGWSGTVVAVNPGDQSATVRCEVEEGHGLARSETMELRLAPGRAEWGPDANGRLRYAVTIGP